MRLDSQTLGRQLDGFPVLISAPDHLFRQHFVSTMPLQVLVLTSVTTSMSADNIYALVEVAFPVPRVPRA